MTNTENTDAREHPELGNVEQITYSEGRSMIMPVQNATRPYLLMHVPLPLQFCQPDVNLRHWLDSLKKMRVEFTDIQSSAFALQCLSVREPYHRLMPPDENSESQAQEVDYCDRYVDQSINYFGLTDKKIAVNSVLWHPKLFKPVVRENVEEAMDNSDAVFVENSSEFLFYYTNEDGLKNGAFKQYEQLCQNAFSSLFPFPNELTDMIFEDIKNVPPSASNPAALWTFLLFNLAWKLPLYSTLRAKYAGPGQNGQFTFQKEIAMTMEVVQTHNRTIKSGHALSPFSEPIAVSKIVSVLDNLFVASLEAIELLIRRVEEIVSPPQRLPNHNATISNEHQKNEKQFCDEIISPLLHSMGYENIRYTHGANEFGKDFIVKDRDKTSEYYIAFVIKAGDVSGAANSKVLDDIVNQIKMAFSVPRKLSDGLTEVYMSKVIVAISGKFLDNAIERLRSDYEKQCQLGYLQLWDKAKIETLIKEHGI